MIGLAMVVGMFVGFCFGFIVCNVRDIQLLQDCDKMMERAERVIKEGRR